MTSNPSIRKEKTDNGYTDITIVLDQSGSMVKLKDDVIGSIKSFVDTQKQNKVDKCLLTLIKFNSRNPYDLSINGTDINLIDSSKIDFNPSGQTPLLDCLGKSIDDAGIRFKNMNSKDRPNRVVFVIITDGQENSSVYFSKNQIKDKISHQSSVYNWHFIYLGANVDSFAEASNIGINHKTTSNYDFSSKGVGVAIKSACNKISEYRQTNLDSSLHYSSHDKNELTNR